MAENRSSDNEVQQIQAPPPVAAADSQQQQLQHGLSVCPSVVCLSVTVSSSSTQIRRYILVLASRLTDTLIVKTF